MYKKIFKKFWKHIGLISAVAMIGLLIQTASATPSAVIFQKTCDLAVYPYNPDATSYVTGQAATSHLQYLSEQECKTHLAYPSQYLPQPPREAENPVLPGSELIKAPIAQHQHAYFNNSNHTAAQNKFYYKSAIKKFEITVKEDGYQNLDRSRISCDIIVPQNYTGNANDLTDCVGRADDLWGGTVVTKTEDAASKTITLLWEFGVNEPGKLPQRYGDNGINFKVYNAQGQDITPANFDLTSPDNRKFEFHVNLPTKNNASQIWSATTVARALIADIALRKTNYPQNFARGCGTGDVNDPNAGWCFLTPNAGPQMVPVQTSSGAHMFYWYDIGSVGSVWKKPTPPPPPQISCANITVFPTQFKVSDASTTIQITDVQPANYTENFTWVLHNPGSTTQLAVESSSRSAVLMNPVAGTTVSIKSLDEKCQAVLTGTENPQQNQCIDLQVSPTQIVRNVATQTFSSTINPTNFVGTTTWTHFKNGTAQETKTGTAATFNNLDANSFISVAAAPASANATCNKQIPIQPQQEYPCIDLQVSQTEILRDVPTQTFYATVNPSNFLGTITWTHLKNGSVVETRFGDRATFNNLDSNSTVTVDAIPASVNAICRRQLNLELIRRPPPRPAGELHKSAFEIKSRGNVIRKNETAEFKVTFRATSETPEVTLYESLRTKLFGTEGGEIALTKGIYGGRDFKVENSSSGADIQECEAVARARGLVCFEGNPFITNGLTLRNLTNQTISIIYRGKLVTSKINENFCKRLDPAFCGEKFTNEIHDSLGNVARATLYTPCPYLLTQGIGDVILESDLSVGSDISACAGVPNIEGPTTTTPPPVNPRTPSTGAGDTLNIPPHTLCQESNSGNANLPEGYRNPLKSVSSAICEVAMTLSDVLTPPAIRKDVLANITRITRYNNNLGIGRSITVSDLNNPPLTGESPNPDAQIYKLKNGNLIVDAFTPPVTKGARTYVIENGDLIIKGNIKYSESPYDLANIKEIPVIAFIVINGSIQIDPSVTELSGIFVAINGEGTNIRANSGKVLGTARSESPMKILGSVYGDIQPLFESRSYVGNARFGQGTIVINYDGRLFYNLPPGLKEVLNIAPEQVAR